MVGIAKEPGLTSISNAAITIGITKEAWAERLALDLTKGWENSQQHDCCWEK
jgi:hypothetical protein